MTRRILKREEVHLFAQQMFIEPLTMRGAVSTEYTTLNKADKVLAFVELIVWWEVTG